MSALVKTALLPYPAQRLYALVNDVATYPEFVPGCSRIEILESTPEKITARVHASARGFSESFTTTNTLTPHQRIDLALTDGPFEHFTGYWQFQPLGNAGCKVTLNLDFRLRGLLRAVEPLVSKAADAVVDAFVERARVVCR